MSTTDIIDESINRLTNLQIETIKKLKKRALQNKEHAPHRYYLQGFVKACDTIIEIIENPITSLNKGNAK